MSTITATAPTRPGGAAVDLEGALVERAQRGDRAALGQLYQRHVEAVYAYVRFRVGDDALAEDLTQDVFMSALRGLSRYTWEGSMAPWLLRIAHNRVANHWRTRSRAPETIALPEQEDAYEAPEPALAVPADVDAGLILDVETAALDAAVGHLTELQRDVVALRFVGGLSLAQTADVTGRSVNAVKNLQHKALAALRRELLPGGLE